VGSPNDAVTWRNHPDGKRREAAQRPAHQFAERRQNVGVIFFRLVKNFRQFILIIKFKIGRIMLPECIIREKDLLLFWSI
jgi:hypothetical protein